jgi:DNA repair exonuclease SbcCD nuclease subunit
MRISIFSDVHLGHASTPETAGDPFEAMSEVISRSLDCDAMLIAGDMFDARTPSTEALTGCMEMLIKPLSARGGARISGGVGRPVDALSPLQLRGIPVVAIHGTHERRVKGLMNPIQALERAGFLVHLHCSGVVIEKAGESVCVQGMSGVPEQFAQAVLERWSPEPRSGCYNILMLHQSVAPFMYSSQLLPVESLPRGFDLYILGHMHESRQAMHNGSAVIIPGSLVPTKLAKEESSPRGFWIHDTSSGHSEFIKTESQRQVHLIDHDGDAASLEKRLEELLAGHFHKKPLVRLRGRGLDSQGLCSRFGDRAILSVRSVSDSPAPEAPSIEEQALSVKELGRSLLRKNLVSSGLDAETFEGIFQLLSQGKDDDVLKLLSPARQN